MDYKAQAEPKAWADEVPVYCAHDAIVDVATLVPNPKNPNQHPDNQIQLLGRIIRQTGWRAPITVSKRSGFNTAVSLLPFWKASKRCRWTTRTTPTTLKNTPIW